MCLAAFREQQVLRLRVALAHHTPDDTLFVVNAVAGA